MQAMSMTCDACGKRIEDMENPVVVFVIAGVAPLHPSAVNEQIPLQQFAMSQEIRDIFDNGHYMTAPRIELCASCFATIFKSAPVDQNTDKNIVDVKDGLAVKSLSRPTKATVGRMPLPAHLHGLKETELRARFDSLKPRVLTPADIAVEEKKATAKKPVKRIEN